MPTTLGTAASTAAVASGGQRARRVTALGVGAVVVAGLGVWWTVRAPRTPPSTSARAASSPAAAGTFTLAVTTRPVTAALELDGQAVGVGAFAGELPRDGRSHALRLTAPGYQTREIFFRDVAPPSLIELTLVAAMPVAPSPALPTAPPRAPMQVARGIAPAPIALDHASRATPAPAPTPRALGPSWDPPASASARSQQVPPSGHTSALPPATRAAALPPGARAPTPSPVSRAPASTAAACTPSAPRQTPPAAPASGVLRMRRAYQ